MFDNELRTVTVDIDILEYYIGNVYNCRNTRYCDLEAYMELAMHERTCSTINSLAKRWKWSTRKVRNFLNFLCTYNMAEMEKTSLRGQYYIRVLKPEGEHE